MTLNAVSSMHVSLLDANPVDTAKPKNASDVNEETVLQYAMDIKAAFDDGFQLTDLLVVITKALEITGTFVEMPSNERKQVAIDVIDKVIDITDGPGPDALLDPILKSVIAFVIDKLVTD